jgi:hypothetical protein
LRKAIYILFAVLIFAACPAMAQEAYYYFGTEYQTESHNKSGTWGVMYLEGMGEHAAWSLTYLNEGRVDFHKRDGLSPQLWGRLNILERHVSVALGAGPFLFYETVVPPTNRSYWNNHGVGAMVSLSATLYTRSRFLVQARGNCIWTNRDTDSYEAILGIGYQLDKPSSPGPLTWVGHRNGLTIDGEITIFAGFTVLNEISDTYAAVESIEYRRGIASYFEWSIGWVNEQHPSSRYGPITQLWFVRPFFDDHLTLGFGAGPYFTFDRHEDHEIKKLNWVVGTTASYRFHPHWALRITWNRVATDYDRDADMVLCGVTYRL